MSAASKKGSSSGNASLGLALFAILGTGLDSFFFIGVSLLLLSLAATFFFFKSSSPFLFGFSHLDPSSLSESLEDDGEGFLFFTIYFLCGEGDFVLGFYFGACYFGAYYFGAYLYPFGAVLW